MWDIKYVMIETCDCQGVADSPRGWRQYSFVSRTVLVTVRSSSSFNLLQLLTLNVNTFFRLDLAQVKLLMKLNKKFQSISPLIEGLEDLRYVLHWSPQFNPGPAKSLD